MPGFQDISPFQENKYDMEAITQVNDAKETSPSSRFLSIYGFLSVLIPFFLFPLMTLFCLYLRQLCQRFREPGEGTVNHGSSSLERPASQSSATSIFLAEEDHSSQRDHSRRTSHDSRTSRTPSYRPYSTENQAAEINDTREYIPGTNFSRTTSEADRCSWLSFDQNFSNIAVDARDAFSYEASHSKDDPTEVFYDVETPEDNISRATSFESFVYAPDDDVSSISLSECNVSWKSLPESDFSRAPLTEGDCFRPILSATGDTIVSASESDVSRASLSEGDGFRPLLSATGDTTVSTSESDVSRASLSEGDGFRPLLSATGDTTVSTSESDVSRASLLEGDGFRPLLSATGDTTVSTPERNTTRFSLSEKDGSSALLSAMGVCNVSSSEIDVPSVSFSDIVSTLWSSAINSFRSLFAVGSGSRPSLPEDDSSGSLLSAADVSNVSSSEIDVPSAPLSEMNISTPRSSGSNRFRSLPVGDGSRPSLPDDIGSGSLLSAVDDCNVSSSEIGFPRFSSDRMNVSSLSSDSDNSSVSFSENNLRDLEERANFIIYLANPNAWRSSSCNSDGSRRPL